MPTRLINTIKLKKRNFKFSYNNFYKLYSISRNLSINKQKKLILLFKGRSQFLWEKMNPPGRAVCRELRIFSLI